MRRQLTWAAAAIASLIVLAFLLPLALLVRTMAADRALAAADQNANALVPVLATVDDRVSLRRVVEGLDSDASSITVFLADGTVIGAPVPKEQADTEVPLARSGQAFTVEEPGGTAIYVPVVQSNQVDVVRSFVPDEVLRRGVSAAWLVLGALGLALVLLATAVADRLAKSIVQPVHDLAHTAEALGHGQLDARVEPTGPPEILEVGHTMNLLAERIGELLAAERESVADLSHRLRTPVTALKLDAESIADPDDRERLTADVEALQRAVDQLITQARRGMRTGAPTSTDLVPITRQRVEFWAALAEDQGRTYELALPALPCFVAVPGEDLVAAIDALLGNVLAHTPDGAPFRVEVTTRGELVVEDEGPGFPDGSLESVLTRGESGGGSTGLGLDIVRQTAEAFGGSISLGATARGGARIVVRFAPPASPR